MSTPSFFSPRLSADGSVPVTAYLRVCPTQGQASLRRQLEHIKEYAANHGMAVVQVFAEAGQRRRGING
jgi:predicted site-specific integrase-resolvase